MKQQRDSTAATLPVILCLIAALSGGGAMAAAAEIDYQRQIQPLFDRYCVACHACFDAPCQLDLSHPAGVERGASKQPVYDATRLEPAPPTRLHIDAQGSDAWRKLGFFPVTQGEEGAPALLLSLLELKKAHPLAAGKPLPDDIEPGIKRKSYCPDPGEAREFTQEHPQLGMPFGFPGLKPAELDLVRDWLAQGAAVTATELQPTAAEKQQIARWEKWLNHSQPERALVSRWLFEHWAIARLYFGDGGSGHFFRLVRSTTPPGKAVKEIATRRPNSDPGQAFFYRFQLQQGTRVLKTHITFALTEALLDRTEAKFFGDTWTLETLPGYSDSERSNPFLTFAAIPASARYQFMLDHAGYFVRTFIRGPVCRGQLATDVIRDHFWVFFQAPDQDPYLTDGGFRKDASPLLDLPGLEDDLLDGAETWWQATEDRNRYQALRQAALKAGRSAGPGLDSVWDGNGTNQNALLTVFRHHDSATVVRGLAGQQPLTVWLLDYPLFERSYYNLVVNFDVFGNLAHQAQTRLYFDLIRNGAEQNFLRLLPADSRQDILDSWYEGSGLIKLWLAYQSIDTGQPSGIAFHSDYPKAELLTSLLQRFSAINAAPDPVNRPSGKSSDRIIAQLSRLSGVPASDMPAIHHLADASMLRITGSDGQHRVFTLVRNRRHSNVAFVLGESLRYEPDKDALSLLPGIATGYPNFIYRVRVEELEQFVETLLSEKSGDRPTFVKQVVDRWGVRRSAPEFWEYFHDINAFLVETDPVEAGLLDLNRYIDY